MYCFSVFGHGMTINKIVIPHPGMCIRTKDMTIKWIVIPTDLGMTITYCHTEISRYDNTSLSCRFIT